MDDLQAARAKRLASPATASEVRRRGIDLEAVVCADLGHRWYQTELARQTDGLYRGLPVRICICAVCETQRVDSLTWGGQVVSRHYVHPDSYLENYRALDPDDQYNRRREYRRLMLAQVKGKRIAPVVGA